jgi:hypothetical protein
MTERILELPVAIAPERVRHGRRTVAPAAIACAQAAPTSSPMSSSPTR